MHDDDSPGLEARERAWHGLQEHREALREIAGELERDLGPDHAPRPGEERQALTWIALMAVCAELDYRRALADPGCAGSFEDAPESPPYGPPQTPGRFYGPPWLCELSGCPPRRFDPRTEAAATQCPRCGKPYLRP